MFIFELIKTYIPPRSGKHDFFLNVKKKSFGFEKKKIGYDTEIGPWFRFPIPKPGFGRTLQTVHEKKFMFISDDIFLAMHFKQIKTYHVFMSHLLSSLP